MKKIIGIIIAVQSVVITGLTINQIKIDNFLKSGISLCQDEDCKEISRWVAMNWNEEEGKNELIHIEYEI